MARIRFLQPLSIFNAVLPVVTPVYALCPVLLGFYETTDVFFGTLADSDGLKGEAMNKSN